MESLGPYRICRKLGAGSYGTVYLAEHTQLEKPVALKMLSAGMDERALKRFQREAQILANLRHPAIVSIDQFGILDGKQPYLVMEYVDGVTLQAEIKERGKIPVEETLQLMIQVCEALEYLKSHGIVHRDITPGNILLAAGKQAKLVDFGTARLFGEETQRLTQTGSFIGTPMYMSPEAALGQADERADVYALGCVMFEALTGKPPYEGESLFALVEAHTHAAIPRCPGIAASVIQKALAKRPEDRYQSASELKDDLLLLQKGQAVSFGFKQRGTPDQQESRQKGRRLVWSTIVAILLMSAFAFGVAVSFEQRNKHPEVSPLAHDDPKTERRLRSSLLLLSKWEANPSITPDKALRRAESALEDAREVGNRRNEVDALRFIALAQAASGRLKEAVQTLDEAISKAKELEHPSLYQLYQEKADALETIGEVDEAAKYFKMATRSTLHENPAYERRAAAYIRHGGIMLRKNEYQQALDSFDAALKEYSAIRPSTFHAVVKAKLARAQALRKLGRTAEASAELKRVEDEILRQDATLIEPSYAELSAIDLISHYKGTDDTPKALAFLKRLDAFKKRGRRVYPIEDNVLEGLRKDLTVGPWKDHKPRN